MADAGIDDPQDVHFVQIKCPLLTSDRIEAANARGHKTGHHQRLRFDGLFARRFGARRRRARSARSTASIARRARPEGLGSVFLGGLDLGRHRTDAQCRHRARQFGDPSASPFVIGHAVMRDAIDGAAVIDGARKRRARSGALPIRRCANGWSIFSPRRKPRRTAPCAAIATSCSRTPTSAPPGMPAPPSAG